MMAAVLSGTLVPMSLVFALTAPVVNESYPVDDSTNVSVSVVPYLKFSKALDQTTIKGDNIEIRQYNLPTDQAGIDATLIWDGVNNKVVFDLDDSLDYETQYYFFVGSGIKDSDGNNFLANTWYYNQRASHEFTTESEPIIPNTPPVMQSITLNPNPAFTNTDITATAIASDGDGNAVTFSYQWKKSITADSFEDIAGETGATLSSDNFVKGNIIKVEVTPNDGTDDGNLMESGPITISNSIPTQPTVSISPDSAYADDDLTCNPSGSTDADIGDNPVGYAYQWYKDGALQDGYISNAVLASQTTAGDVWKCEVVANDGEAQSSASESSVTVADDIIPLQDKIPPTVAKLGDDSSDLVLPTGAADLIFSEELSSSSKTAVQNALTAGADRTLTYAWSGATLTITATEATTFANDVVVNVSDLAGNAAELLLVDSALSVDQTAPDTGTGDATLNNTTPQIVITSPTQEVNITIGSGTTNPTIDVSSFISGGTGTIPKITIESENADVAIPASTTVTSEDTSWNGIINAPTVTTVALPETSGETTTLNTAIEIGFTGAKLSFDKAVRILIPNQAGKKAGYVRNGTAFTEITSICSADSQAAGDALSADGDCKIDVGSDLVIWTKHFTKFAAYTQTANSSNGGSGNSGGGGGIISATPPANTSVVINNREAETASANVVLILSASSAIQMAISNNSDFTDVSLETYAISKEWVLTSGTGEKTVYAKFRSSNGGVSSVVSDAIILNPNPKGKVLGATTTEILDGDIIQCKSCSQPFAVYIVKIAGDTKYIRHIVSLEIFNHYKHLKWENLKQVSYLNDYSSSGRVRVNTGTNGTAAPTDKVYEINGDQTKRWINMTAEQFLSHGGSEPAIFNINYGESNLYIAGADVASL